MINEPLLGLSGPEATQLSTAAETLELTLVWLHFSRGRDWRTAQNPDSPNVTITVKYTQEANLKS